MVKPIAVIAGLAALGGAYFWFRSNPPPASPGVDAPKTAAAPAQPPTLPPATATVAAPPLRVGTKSEHPDWMVFPDGSAYPPLNGVAKAPNVAWHKMLPFTPVVRVERDTLGRDWYVHENGARSTTYIDGAGKAVSDVSMDMPVKPILDDAPTDKK